MYLLFEEPSSWFRGQQALVRLLQRDEVRDLLKPEASRYGRPFAEHGVYAAIVEIEEPLENETGEQLVLRELLGRVDMRILRQRLLHCIQRNQRHHPWRLAAGRHNEAR